jgi:periplasmic protein CpxP/Spy
MMKTFDRTTRTVAMAGLAAALMLLPLGITPADARSEGTVLQLAQAPGPGGAPPRGAGGPQSPGGAKAPAGNAAGTSQIDREIADLKKQLKITPQQEPQFNAFAEIMRSNAQEMDAQMSQGSPNQNPNAVESLKREQQLTETQAAGLKRLVPALQSLYDTLSDPQKKIADKVIGGGGEPAPGPQRGRG